MNQQHPDLQFLPETALKELFNIENIAKILESHKERLQSDISILLSYIETRATRIFAVLAWSQLEELIEEFFLYDFNDEKLPVRVEIDEEQNLIEAFSFRSRWLSVDEHPFNFNRWTERNIDAFCDHDQWPFLSPIFYEEKFRYEFHERTRMPFVDERPQSEKETLFSVVQEWRIHRDHIRNPHLIRLPNDPKDHPTVAVKRLKQLDLTDDEFKTLTEAEVDALETIRKLNHPHLVRAVAYYTRGKSHYIMFPWADQGNLRDIWVKDRPKLDEKFLQWVFSQLYGLAEAIKALHHSNKEKALRHGDLKPENILCFENLEKEQNNGFLSCILVVADVGSSRSHDNVTELRTNSTRTKIGTIKYKPPETELQPNEPLSRRYDIWSLGCIYLEFMIWLLYGPGGFVQFREDLNSLGENTRFYVVEGGLDLRNRTFRLNGVVQRWVDWIKEDKRCPHHTAMRRLLDLVVDRLLIADISRASSVFTRGTQQTVDSTATNPAPVPTIIIRQPLFEVDPADRLKSSRATAEELCDELMMILDDTTSKHLEWIDWSVSAQSGPGRFADRLGTTDN
ncbi:kinase-like protein [Periconia macrospinosa]|uniref:Kinase-like protein n=1 Tax=Periconia macrospinosa TaxID=97972 RepID=A0A2V1D1S1_9PLEO|nr:kinase-like protein [Periconia macrospinosa]